MENNAYDTIQQKGETPYIKRELVQNQILIAESEQELLSLFNHYLSSLGMKTETANSSERALDCFHDGEMKGSPYDAILLDTHLSNPSGLDVAKRIRTEKPGQKLVLVTTTSREYLSSECLKTAGIRDNDILIMPFKMSKLKIALETN